MTSILRKQNTPLTPSTILQGVGWAPQQVRMLWRNIYCSCWKLNSTPLITHSPSQQPTCYISLLIPQKNWFHFINTHICEFSTGNKTEDLLFYITLTEVSLVNTTYNRNTECQKNLVIQNRHRVAVCGTLPCYVQLSNIINENLQVLVILNQE